MTWTATTFMEMLTVAISVQKMMKIVTQFVGTLTFVLPMQLMIGVRGTDEVDCKTRNICMSGRGPFDPLNDIDSDDRRTPEDKRPNDPSHDEDGVGICGDVDTCPRDAANDIDSDNICGDVNACAQDANNDIDSTL